METLPGPEQIAPRSHSRHRPHPAGQPLPGPPALPTALLSAGPRVDTEGLQGRGPGRACEEPAGSTASRELSLYREHRAPPLWLPPSPGARVQSPQARTKARALGPDLPGLRERRQENSQAGAVQMPQNADTDPSDFASTVM